MRLDRNDPGRPIAGRVDGVLLVVAALLAPIVLAAAWPGARGGGDVIVPELELPASGLVAMRQQVMPQAVVAAHRQYQDSRVEAYRRAERMRAVIAAQREYQTSRVVAYLQAELERLRGPALLGLYAPGRCGLPPDVIAAAD